MHWPFGGDDEAKKIFDAIIGAAFAVRRTLGGRLPREVYRSALRLELQQRSVAVTERPSLVVKYQGRPVGEFTPDLLVGERVVVELEAAPRLPERLLEDARCALEAARIGAGMVLNFGAPKLEYRRLRRVA